MKPANVRIKKEDCSMDSDRKRKMPLVDPPQSKRATMDVKKESVEGDESAAHNQQTPENGLPEGPPNQHKGKLTCDVCGKNWKYLSALEIHMRTHTGQKPFVCEKCGLGFAQKWNLNQHKSTCGRRKDPKIYQFECDQCDGRFKERKTFQTHKRVHSGKHKCGICGRAFSSPSAVEEHMVTHTGDKPWACKYCNRPFGRKDHCGRHEKTCKKGQQSHTPASKVTTDEVPEESEDELVPDKGEYWCQFCERKFTQESVQRRHEKSCPQKPNVAHTDVPNGQSGQDEAVSMDDLVPANPPLSPIGEDAAWDWDQRDYTDTVDELLPPAEAQPPVPEQQHSTAEQERKVRGWLPIQPKVVPKDEPDDGPWHFTHPQPSSLAEPLPAGNLHGHVESDSRSRQLLAENEEMRRERDKAADHKKELQPLSSSMNLQEIPKTQPTFSSVDHTSKSRRAGELEADNEIQELLKELERVTEEIGNYRRENMQMKRKSFVSDSRHRQLQAEIGELCLQLKNKLQDSESRRTREMEAELQDLRRELKKVMEESSKMKDESDARNGQLQAENEELRKKLERSEEEKKKAMDECRQKEDERLELKKKMRLLAYSLPSRKESEARRGRSLEECRQLIMEELADSPCGDGAQSEKDNSYITPELFKLDQKCPFCWNDHAADDCSVAPSLKSRLALRSIKFLCRRCLLLHPRRPCSKIVPCQYCGSTEHHSRICSSDEHESCLKTRSNS